MCQSNLNDSIISYKYDNISYYSFIVLYTFIVKLCYNVTCGIVVYIPTCPQEWIIICGKACIHFSKRKRKKK